MEYASYKWIKRFYRLITGWVPVAKYRRRLRWRLMSDFYKQEQYEQKLRDDLIHAKREKERVQIRLERNLMERNSSSDISLNEKSDGDPGDRDAAIQDQFYRCNPNFNSPDYVPRSDKKHVRKENEAMLIAFYLPQFHRFAENDEWWGRGFTEWSNVGRAVPQYLGQYQPQIPDEFGYYDLTSEGIMQKQVALARQYGIHGFCFHYYWFGRGRKLMEGPLLKWLSDSSLDFPFCLSWANEPWTRAWDGGDKDILMSQEFDASDIDRFYEDIRPFFQDTRYIKVEGKPLLIIYRAHMFEKSLMRSALERWNEKAREEGYRGIHAVCARTFSFNDEPMEWGFDAAVEFPPHNCFMKECGITMPLLNNDFEGTIFDAECVIDRITNYPSDSCPVYRTVAPGWDNTARKGKNSLSLYGLTVDQYSRWLESALKFSYAHHAPGNCFVFINAWNEWGEGAHLEPDRKYGFAYLAATEKILSETMR